MTKFINWRGYILMSDALRGIEGGKTYYLKFDKERFPRLANHPRLANLCGDEDGSKQIWLRKDYLFTTC